MSRPEKRPRATGLADEANAGSSRDGSRQFKRPKKGGASSHRHRPEIRQTPLHLAQGLDKQITLPANLDVEYNLSGYSREIHALHEAIRASGGGSSVRAWQMLPRHKRRRNASHNLLALPKRLRQKGRSEMRASNTIPQTRSEVRKRRGEKRGGSGMGAIKTSKGRLMLQRGSLGAYPRRREGKRRSLLVSRAMLAAMRGKAWLETHLWHAKRFRMSGREGKIVGQERVEGVDRWGFSLPEESTLKSYRGSWRDHKNHVTLLDKSCDSWFRIAWARNAPVGAFEDQVHILESVLSHAGALPQISLTNRVAETFLCAPATYDASELESSMASTPHRVKCPLQVYCFKKSVGTSGKAFAEILIRAHPATTSQVERALRRSLEILSMNSKDRFGLLRMQRLNSVPHPLLSAGSGAIGRHHSKASQARKTSAKQRSLQPFEKAVQSRWQRSEAFNIFEVSGPNAGSLLARVLRPVQSHSDSLAMAALRLGRLQHGETLSLRVHDPRLSFPPKKKAGSSNLSKSQKQRLSKRMQKRRLEIASEEFVCDLFASGASPPKFTKGEIDRRRSRLAVPGARLLPTSRDDTIPVVVICQTSSGQSGQLQGTQSFSLLVPRGWGQAFWLSLSHPGTRVLGQLQEHALRYDRGKPTFPYDWPGTLAFQRWEEKETARAFAEWKRKPPAKRVNPSVSGVRWPFGGEGMWHEVVKNGSEIVKQGSAPATGWSTRPWLYLDSQQKSLQRLKESYYSRTTSGPELADTAASLSLSAYSGALITVQLTACRRGSFAKWDEVHFLNDQQASVWRRALLAVEKGSRTHCDIRQLECEGVEKMYSKVESRKLSSHIGTVTTGNFSLSQGKCTAIASISLLAYLAITHRDHLTAKEEVATNESGKHIRNPISTQGLVLVRAVNAGGSVRAASIRPVSLF